MRKLFVLTLAFLLAVSFVLPAIAFEFELTGEHENRFRYFGRTGDKDLFGAAGMQNSIALGGVDWYGFPLGKNQFIGFAGPNIYGRGWTPPRSWYTSNAAPLGATALSYPIPDLPSGSGNVTITRGGFSKFGSDASDNGFRLTLRPVIRVNPAIRVFGVYNIGGMRNKYALRNEELPTTFGAFPGIVGSPWHYGQSVGQAPLERYYMSQSSMNAYEGTFGVWEQARVTVHVPWAVLSYGIKDFPFGTGATFGYNTRAEMFLTVVPYGPFRFLYALWLGRSGFLEGWQTTVDRDEKPNGFHAGAFTYDAGNISAGGAVIYQKIHTPSNPVFSDQGFLGTGNVDQDLLVNQVFAKYNNGRFFANAEYSWLNADTHTPANPLLLGFPVLAATERHLEGYHSFLEAGVMAGPARLSFLWAQSSGSVLGSLLNLATTGALSPNPTKLNVRYPINYQALEPYEYLMFNTFAGGNNGSWTALDVAFVTDEHGQMSDAFCFAGRFDYAVASNLNVWGSYMWAHRLEQHGQWNGAMPFGLGVTDQTGTTSGEALIAGVAGLPPGFLIPAYGGLTPFIPDGFIGWEANAGVDWKLLENWTLKLRYAYWQPGDWFNFAYYAFVPGGPLNDGRIGSLQGRDAIQAFQGSLMTEF